MTPKQIKSLRERLGVNQTDFAAMLFLPDKSAVSRLESGDRVPRGLLLKQLRDLQKNSRKPQPV